MYSERERAGGNEYALRFAVMCTVESTMCEHMPQTLQYSDTPKCERTRQEITGSKMPCRHDGTK